MRYAANSMAIRMKYRDILILHSSFFLLIMKQIPRWKAGGRGLMLPWWGFLLSIISWCWWSQASIPLGQEEGADLCVGSPTTVMDWVSNWVERWMKNAIFSLPTFSIPYDYTAFWTTSRCPLRPQLIGPGWTLEPKESNIRTDTQVVCIGFWN